MSDDPGLVRQQAQGNYIAQATHGGVANVQVVLPPEPVQEQNRVRFLKRLSAEYERQWEQALQGTSLMILGLTSRPDAVRHHTEKFFRGPALPERQLPANTSIVEIYNQSGHELLILGEPGAGKSTLLLELARHLVERAQQDQQQPFPIILPLSSWAVKQPPLVDWLAEQLALIYDVPQQLSRQWVQANQILPLLDGLDEVPQGARVVCIEAIGAYRKEHLVPMVLCSRQAEYEEITRQQRLVLQSAVVIQPLTQEQVDAYLLRNDQSLASVRAVLHSNAVLRDLTTTPLMLNVLTQTYEGAAEQALSLQGTAEQQQRQVLAAYVEQMVQRKGDEKRYPLEYTRSRLGWLARQMRERNQTVFYLEHLQPDWLELQHHPLYDALAIWLPAILMGMCAGLVARAFSVSFSGWEDVFQFAVLGGVLGGLFSTIAPKESGQSLLVEGHRLQKKRRLWQRHLLISSMLGLIIAVYFGVSGYGLDGWPGGCLIFGGMMGLGCLLMLIAHVDQPRQEAPGMMTQRGKRLGYLLSTVHARRALLVGFIFGLSYGLSVELNFRLSEPSTWLDFGWSYALVYWPGDVLSFGLIGILMSLALTPLASNVRLTEHLRWSWLSLFSNLRSRMHISNAFLVTGMAVVIYGLTYGLAFDMECGQPFGLSCGLSAGLSIGLSYGLSIGLSYWLLLGLFQSVVSERVDDQHRQVPNQGIRHSTCNSLLLGFISSILLLLSYELSYKLSSYVDYIQTTGYNPGLGYALSVMLSGGLLICAVSGGVAVWRHYLLRLLLKRSRTFPWRAVAFLDDATVRGLLRRVGGGYSFNHRLLMDYLADRDTVTDSTAL